jgi:hypothetical protein
VELILVAFGVGIRCSYNSKSTQASEKSSKNVASSSKASETLEPALYSIYLSDGV